MIATGPFCVYPSHWFFPPLCWMFNCCILNPQIHYLQSERNTPPLNITPYNTTVSMFNFEVQLERVWAEVFPAASIPQSVRDLYNLQQMQSLSKTLYGRSTLSTPRNRRAESNAPLSGTHCSFYAGSVFGWSLGQLVKGGY